MSRMVKVRNDGARLAREFASVLTPLESETLVLMYEGEEMAARHRTAWPLTREALVQAGLVNKVGDSSDERRRYYAITKFGRRVAEAEATRLARLVEFARSKNLVQHGRLSR